MAWNLDRGWVKAAAFLIVLLFGVTLLDYLVLGEVGMRVLPLSYGAERWVFYILGVLTVVVALLVYGAGRGVEGGRSFSSQVRIHRLILGFAAIPIFLTALSFLGSLSWQMELMTHFRVQYGALLLVAATLLAIFRKWKHAIFVGMFILANLLSLFPHIYSHEVSETTDGQKVRLALLNINSRNESFEKVRDFIASSDADLLVIAEVTDKWMDELKILRLDYPYVVGDPSEGNFGIALFSRIPLEEASIVELGDVGAPSVSAVLSVEDLRFKLLGTHTLPPRDAAYAAYRDRQYEALAEFVKESELAVIVLGDLNATPWSPAFTNLVRNSGLEDSSRGWGLSYTWPAGLWLLGVPIDHCLVSKDLEVVHREVGPDIGSGHYPLVVNVRLQ